MPWYILYSMNGRWYGNWTHLQDRGDYYHCELKPSLNVSPYKYFWTEGWCRREFWASRQRFRLLPPYIVICWDSSGNLHVGLSHIYTWGYLSHIYTWGYLVTCVLRVQLAQHAAVKTISLILPMLQPGIDPFFSSHVVIVLTSLGARPSLIILLLRMRESGSETIYWLVLFHLIRTRTY